MRFVLKAVFFFGLLATFYWLGKFYSTLGYEYNSEGNYWDGVVNHHSGERIVLFIFFLFTALATALVFWFSRNLHEY